MSARTRWLLRNGGPAIVWLLLAIGFAIVGLYPPAIVAAGAAATSALAVRLQVWVFRLGFAYGRGGALVDVERVAKGYPATPRDAPMPNPWDPFPDWPDDETPAASDPGHTRRNGV